jgi:hypothetical protein
VTEQHISLRRLRRALEAYEAMFHTRPNTINYVDFCQVMEFDLMFSQGEKLFQTYSFFVWNPATEIWERRVEMRELLCRLVSLVKGSLEDKVNYIFHLYDPQGTGYIDREAMTALLRVAHFAEKDDEVMLMSFAAVVLRRY